MSKTESLAYESHLKAYRDNQSVLSTAERRGREEGREEGEQAKAVEIAGNMKQKGLAVALIAELTGLSESDIERL